MMPSTEVNICWGNSMSSKNVGHDPLQENYPWGSILPGGVPPWRKTPPSWEVGASTASFSQYFDEAWSQLVKKIKVDEISGENVSKDTEAVPSEGGQIATVSPSASFVEDFDERWKQMMSSQTVGAAHSPIGSVAGLLLHTDEAATAETRVEPHERDLELSDESTGENKQENIPEEKGIVTPPRRWTTKKNIKAQKHAQKEVNETPKGISPVNKYTYSTTSPSSIFDFNELDVLQMVDESQNSMVPSGVLNVCIASSSSNTSESAESDQDRGVHEVHVQVDVQVEVDKIGDIGGQYVHEHVEKGYM